MIRSYSGKKPAIDASAFIHDSAEVIGRVALARDVSIWPMAVLRGDVDAIKVGAGTNIQDHTVVHCRKGQPAVIGKGVTVGHRVIIHGARIGDGCLIGMGAIIMESEIGEECLVAAGALVLKGQKIAPRSLVLGSPAKVARKLTAGEIAGLRKSAKDYVGHGRRHRRTSHIAFRP